MDELTDNQLQELRADLDALAIELQRQVEVIEEDVRRSSRRVRVCSRCCGSVIQIVVTGTF